VWFWSPIAKLVWDSLCIGSVKKAMTTLCMHKFNVQGEFFFKKFDMQGAKGEC
jgi:hypothetical protein